MPRRIFSDSEEKDITKRYLQGENAPALAESYFCHTNTIYCVLNRRGTQRREAGFHRFTPLYNFAKHYRIISNGCWQWTGFIQPDGYARFIIHPPRQKGKRGRYKRFMAHRFSYEIKYGSIPKGKHLHHTCRNRSCVNPDHLQLTTKSEHPLLDNTIVAINAHKTHCKRGHPLSGTNLHKRPDGGRVCLSCMRLRVQKQTG